MRLVLACGCFDLFHVAHLRYLEQAKAMGDYLFVSVTMDAFVGKGDGRPVIPEAERLEIVRALRCVDEARLYRDGYDALKELKPAVFCKGDDWRQGIPQEILEFGAANNIRIAFTKANSHVTTTNLIKRLKCA